MKAVLFKLKHRFRDKARFSIFEHILNLNHCRVFETKPIFPSLSIIHNSKQNSFSFLTQSITKSKKFLMKTKSTAELYLESKFSQILFVK